MLLGKLNLYILTHCTKLPAHSLTSIDHNRQQCPLCLSGLNNKLSQIKIKFTLASQDDEEVQTINTNTRIVFNTQINVFLDTETKVSSV